MTKSSPSHRETWEAIPWILNGTASEAEARSAKEHLRECAACREALAFEQSLRDALQQPQLNQGNAEQSWQGLCARLDGAAPAKKHWRGAHTASAAHRSRRSMGIPIRWLAAAVIIEAVALGTVTSAWWSTRPERESAGIYRTLSHVDATAPAPTIRVVLASGMTLEQLRALLDSAHLQVVAGPSAAGVWSLAPAEDASSVATEAALRELRGNAQVQFAEPLDTAAHAIPKP